MTRLVKLFLLPFIIFLLTGNGKAQDSLMYSFRDSLLMDSTFANTKDVELYLYHLNTILEYQESELDKMTTYLEYQQSIIKLQKLMIYVLLGVIALIVLILIIRWLSKRFERAYAIYKVKKHEMAAAATLQGLLKHWKVKENLKNIQSQLQPDAEDVVSLDKWVEVASKYGMEVHSLQGDMNVLLALVNHPVAVVFSNHISVVYKCKKDRILMADSYYGFFELKPYYFANNWFLDGKNEKGTFVVLVPGQERGRKFEKYRQKLQEAEKADRKLLKQLNLH